MSKNKVNPPAMTMDGDPNIQDLKNFLIESRTKFNKLRENPAKEEHLSNFTIMRQIGKGAFGKVFLVRNNHTGTHHAMKVMSKEEILTKGEFKHVQNEKNISLCVHFPFVIRVDCFIIDNSNIYFVMPFIAGGDIFTHLRRVNRFSEQLVRFYGAQVILALEYLHFLDIVYRDLKPENVLIDRTGYVKISDFGFSKVVKHRTYTICGTPEYIAPEIIMEKGHGVAADWWSLGIFLFELASGRTPFYHIQQMNMYKLAVNQKYKFPNHFTSELKDFIKQTLQTDLSKRLGNLKDGVKDIKEHKWFRPIDWNRILNRKMKPLYIPKGTFLIEIKSDRDIVLNIENEDRFHLEFQDF